MELRHLRYFLAVAEELSFTKASVKLGVAQPSLSRQIQQLEDELGVRLFDRTKRELQLTEAGRFFLEQGTSTLKRMDVVVRSTRRLASQESAQFIVGVGPSALYDPLPNAIRRFCRDFPDLKVRLSGQSSMQHQIESLRTGKIHVGFSCVAVTDREIASETILEEPLLVVLPRMHRLLRIAKLTLCQLALESFVLYPAEQHPNTYAAHIVSLFHQRGLVPRIETRAGDVHLAVKMVSAGFGVTLVPASVKGLHGNGVEYLPLQDGGVYSPLIMNYRKNDCSPTVEEFRDFMKVFTRTSHL